MKFLLIQLSDIHFTETENAVLLKEEQLFEAVRNSTLEYEEIFLYSSIERLQDRA
jgi:hypothetical protein